MRFQATNSFLVTSWSFFFIYFNFRCERKIIHLPASITLFILQRSQQPYEYIWGNMYVHTFKSIILNTTLVVGGVFACFNFRLPSNNAAIEWRQMTLNYWDTFFPIRIRSQWMFSFWFLHWSHDSCHALSIFHTSAFDALHYVHEESISFFQRSRKSADCSTEHIWNSQRVIIFSFVFFFASRSRDHFFILRVKCNQTQWKSVFNLLFPPWVVERARN